MEHNNMGLVMTKDTTWWVITLPACVGSKTLLDTYILFSLLMASLSLALLSWAFVSGGVAWKNGRNRRGKVPIHGPRGLPFIGTLFNLSRGLAHRTLARMAWSRAATQLMAFSLGSTPVVVSSDPTIAKEILTSPNFANRPIKQSAKSLMFSRAIGFAPNGTYWRLLRRIASTHLFSPLRILAHEPHRQLECAAMLRNIANEQQRTGLVSLRRHLQLASLNNIMGCVFGKRYNEGSAEFEELKDLVREGFELLGAFNWSDYLPWLGWFYDPIRVDERCKRLVPRVRRLVMGIIEEHRARGRGGHGGGGGDTCDFVDVLLSLDGEEKLCDDDMVAVLWEMIFRGTDTTALLTEWVMAELVLHLDIQEILQKELDDVVASKDGHLCEFDVARLSLLQAVIKETLRVHPPGPLLSWARLSTSDVQLSNGMVVPANTTAMVNMWAITHDPHVWEDPLEFKPERFVDADVDVRGCDLRLAPFGAGRRVCPGKNLGLTTVALWVAKLVHTFKWVAHGSNPVDLSEILKLSCEMKNPLCVVAVPRN